MCLLEGAQLHAQTDQGSAGLPALGVRGGGSPPAFALRPSLSLRSSKAVPWTIEPALGFDAMWKEGWKVSIDYAQAFGGFDGSAPPSYRLLGAAGMELGWAATHPWWARPSLVAFTRFRSLGSAGDNSRFGALLTFTTGAEPETVGWSANAGAGYSRMMTRTADGGIVGWSDDPLMTIGLELRPARPLGFRLAVADFDDVDAGFPSRTFVLLGASAQLSPELGLRSPVAGLRIGLGLSDVAGSQAAVGSFSLAFSLGFPLPIGGTRAEISSQ
ncbi:MAG TPA: hypothetical protein VMC79_05375 [Rectinemataceae bacterium]|nr:hypothetical protein [Rectinemataceae bacterium]